MLATAFPDNNNKTESLTFTEKPHMKHKTQKRPKSKIVRTHHYKCAYVTVMGVLIIFSVILQTVLEGRGVSVAVTTS